MPLPLLFTLPPSSRHEIILLDTSAPKALTLKSLNAQVSDVISSSPNCAEFMGQYKKASEVKETIQQFRIHWDLKSRDPKIWPEFTVLTDENFRAVVELLRINPGRDVLEVKVGKEE